ncbi:MAG: dynamin family protein [Dolichospermum lemmermannii FEM_B0920]
MNNSNEQNMDDKFDAKRTELLSLLNKSYEIVDRLDKSGYFPSDTEDLRNQINTTSRHCHEGLFTIALIASFQSGKSTTLNAFADGREIAPRGLGGGGIKTSACLVKVRNPNQGEKETAKITWRTHKDLLLRLDEILGTTACLIPNSEISKKLRVIKQNKAKSITEKEKEKYNREYFSIIDFRTVAGKILLQQALMEELKVCNDSVQKGSEEIEDKLDLLRFAMIVLAYHNDPALKNLQEQTDFQPNEIENYLKFPEEFTERWNKCFDNFQENLVGKEFKLSEVMYAFIEEVTYIVNSENLKKSGAQIVDCPGLFISHYDTLTARIAMQESSAIWYLLTGDKQLSKSEKETLSIIKSAGLASKVFFGVNYKDNPDTKKNVFSEILQELKKLGFTDSYQIQFLYFNAFLALRAMQGEKLLSNSLDSYSQEQIKRDAMAMLGEGTEFESVEQAWLDSLEEVINKVVTKSRRKEMISSGFAEKTVELVKSESKWDLVTDQIKQYVFETKAWSVLIDLGCEPVINTLGKTETSLKVAEDNAKKSLEQAEQEWEDARQKLALFQDESQAIITDYIDDNWDIVLAQSFWKEVFVPSIKATGKTAAPIIANEATIKNALRDTLTNIGNVITPGVNWFVKKFNENFNTNFNDIEPSETLKERCGQIIRNEFENNVNINSQGWFNSLKKGGNQDYETKILRRVVKACVLLAKEWESLDLNHNSYLQGLDVNIPKLSGDIRRDMEKFSSTGFDGAVDKSIEKPFQDISITFASLYFLFLFDLVFPGLGMILFTAAVVAIVVISRFKSKEDYIKDISDKINEELEKGVKLNQGDITIKLKEKLKVVRNFYLDSITNSFKKMSKQLEQRIEEANAILSSTQAERDKIATIAKAFRQRDIEPLRQELQRFQSSVEEIWKKPS